MRTANFAHAYKAAYLYFRTEADAAGVADEIRRSPRIRAAFPSLRARQARQEVKGIPQYRRPENPHWPDMGLPPPGWPLGASWIAHVGQPIGGALGGLRVDARHQDVVEVVARTGLYDPKWHRDGIPAPYAKQLKQDRDLKVWLMDRRRGPVPLSDLYPTMAANEIPDLMRRAYLERGYMAGHRLPPPSAAQHFSPASAPEAASPRPRLPLPQAKPPPSNSPTSRVDPQGTQPRGAGAGSGATVSAAGAMYDPGFPTGTPPLSPDSVIIDEVQTGSHTAEHAEGAEQEPWTEERFQAVLRGWGLEQVDEGQTDEEGTGHQCYFVALREALAAKGETDTTVNIKSEIRGMLEEPRWGEYYEGEGALGRITVRQGPPGSAPTPDQPTSTWREHLRRQGSHGGEPLSYVVAKLLGRPVMVIAAETASVGLRVQVAPTEEHPDGAHYAVVRQGDLFVYRPKLRGPHLPIPSETIVVAHHRWHYTAAIP